MFPPFRQNEWQGSPNAGGRMRHTLFLLLLVSPRLYAQSSWSCELIQELPENSICLAMDTDDPFIAVGDLVTLRVYTLSDADTLAEVGSLLMDDIFYDLCIQDSLVYCATGSGLSIVSILPSQGLELLPLYTELPVGSIEALEVEGDRLYCSPGYDGETSVLWTLDCGDPTAPELLDVNSQQMCSSDGLERVGDYLYSCRQSYLMIYDVGSLPTDIVPGYVTQGWPVDIRYDGRVYVTDGVGGLTVLSVDEEGPRFPVLLGGYALPGLIGQVDVREGVACVAHRDSGLVVLDVTQPEQIRRLCGVPLENAAFVGRLGNTLCVGTYSSGMSIYRLQAETGAHPERNLLPATPRLRSIAPNPFNPRTRITIDLPGPMPVRLEVYNLAGQRVRLLLDELRPAGSHVLFWDGRSEDGGLAASGTYLLRMLAGDTSESRTITLLR